ncbi:MAG: IucA/IucC family siderophore biosynthesis protein [Endozoicomonas sp. (ex Botrylloides leachii)]|nr:IucA/IucC family siderophore biosynthesis protein [Endozoicomonas sp. (ex Botrylloides leachii)]
MHRSTHKQSINHLTPEAWAKANSQMINKMLSQFAHERLLFPEIIGHHEAWTEYELKTGNALCYRFNARILMLDHWWIDTKTLRKLNNGQQYPLDAMAFITEFSDILGLSPEILPSYLEEITNTLYSSAYKLTHAKLSSKQLVSSHYQAIEAAMTEGHPSFAANNARIGFTAEDYRQYTPETGMNFHLIWVAARKDKTIFSTVDNLSYEQLITEELSAESRCQFTELIHKKGLDSKDYLFIPVHPWQWNNKIVYMYAADIAASDLIYLGESEDNYQPQQSIRTFFNNDHPHKRYVKTALSIRNMGFVRGLSPYYMEGTPSINQWVASTIEKDPFLASVGFQALQEVAAVGFANKRFESATHSTSPYRKMLSSLWRESPINKIKPNQQLMTMAALLHVDAHGDALLPELIKQSGLSTKEWLQHYLNCYLTPLLHCFYAYDLVFMPHGENLILVMENHQPIKAFIKDIAEETGILNTTTALPEPAQRITVSVPESIKLLSIQTDIFVGFFRYIAHILLAHSGFSEHDFWYQVAQCIHHYQNDHPSMADKFSRYDLFMPTFTHSCLNRLQIQNNQQMIDLGDPTKNLKFVDTLTNPLAPFR